MGNTWQNMGSAVRSQTNFPLIMHTDFLPEIKSVAILKNFLYTVNSCLLYTSSEAAASTDGKTYKVGICQLVQHVALDVATQGFKDALTDALGDAVTFDEQNAQGDSNTCSTIINSFVSNKVDLILANATPALQAAQAGTNEIPVLGTAVTEYGVALGIDGFDGLVGGNISGTSDLAPLDEQAAMLHELFPDAKNVGPVSYTHLDVYKRQPLQRLSPVR